MYRTLVLIILMSLAPHCFAAEQTLGDDSEGNIRISLAISPSLQIAVVNQITIDILQTDIDANFEEVVCIQGHEGGRYRLIASGPGGDFALTSEAGDTLPYSVFYKGDPDAAEFDELSSGMPSPAYDLISNASACGIDTNFRVTFRKEDLQTVKSGLYTGQLILLVSPL